MHPEKVLMVEGKDDEHVLKHLSGNRCGPRFDEVEPYEGYPRLLAAIVPRLKAGGNEKVFGIVLDADTNLEARWQSVRDRLVELGYNNVPHTPAADGTIVDPPNDAFLPRVGIWIMPDNQTTGNLEDFLKFLVPADSELYEHVISSVDGIPPSEQKFSTVDRSKVLIHTWLAWQKDPGKPLGTAITAKYLDPTVPQVDTLISWLNRPFN